MSYAMQCLISSQRGCPPLDGQVRWLMAKTQYFAPALAAAAFHGGSGGPSRGAAEHSIENIISCPPPVHCRQQDRPLTVNDGLHAAHCACYPSWILIHGRVGGTRRYPASLDGFFP